LRSKKFLGEISSGPNGIFFLSLAQSSFSNEKLFISNPSFEPESSELNNFLALGSKYGIPNNFTIMTENIIASDSYLCSSSQGPSPFRFLSINGNNSHLVTQAHMSVANCLLGEGGVMALGTWQDWPGVVAGFYHHMCTISTSNLVPLILPFGRLFVTTRSHYDIYALELSKDPIVVNYMKEIEVFGYMCHTGKFVEVIPEKEIVANWPKLAT